MAYWLVKSEPDDYSIDQLKKDRVTYWDGVRNYQARNFLREMQKGEQVLYYHSNAKPPCVVGVASVAKVAYPDPTQFDKRSRYFDPKATKDNPRWFCPDLKFVKKFSEPAALDLLRKQKVLKDMPLLQRGSRLSVQPVTKRQFDSIVKLCS